MPSSSRLRAWIFEIQVCRFGSQAWISGPQAWSSETQAWIFESHVWISESQAWIIETQAWIFEPQTWISKTQAWVSEAQAWISETQAWLSETQAWYSEIALHCTQPFSVIYVVLRVACQHSERTNCCMRYPCIAQITGSQSVWATCGKASVANVLTFQSSPCKSGTTDDTMMFDSPCCPTSTAVVSCPPRPLLCGT